MESITKNRQSVDRLRELVERAFGAAQVPDGIAWVAEEGHGWFNVVYRLRLRDGSDVVLKIAPPAGIDVMTYERGAMATELHALRLIREHTAVPVPAVLFADESHELCDADYFFMSCVEGDNLGVIKDGLSSTERDAYGELIGAANRELNSIRGVGFGPLRGPGSPSWRTVFGGMLEDVLRNGERRQVELGWEYDVIRELIAEHAGCLDEVVEPRFVEWDLWESNVIVDGGRIVGIIDHERAFFGDPLIEAGFTATQLPAYGDSSAFMRGYGHSGLTDSEQLRRRLYCLHLVLIMVIETVYRGHTDPWQYDWSRARLDELMALFAVDRGRRDTSGSQGCRSRPSPSEASRARPS